MGLDEICVQVIVILVVILIFNILIFLTGNSAVSSPVPIPALSPATVTTLPCDDDDGDLSAL